MASVGIYADQPLLLSPETETESPGHWTLDKQNGNAFMQEAILSPHQKSLDLVQLNFLHFSMLLSVG